MVHQPRHFKSQRISNLKIHNDSTYFILVGYIDILPNIEIVEIKSRRNSIFKLTCRVRANPLEDNSTLFPLLGTI